MENTEKALYEQLRKHFSGDPRRIELMSKLVLAVTALCTVTYSKLALLINTEVKLESNVRRIQRFMCDYVFSQKSYVQLIWKLFVRPNNRVMLTMDRTNWKFGSKPINILTIGIAYNKVSIPLIWKVLPKNGNSNTKERIELLELLQSLLKPEQLKQVRYLVGDREFIGKKWLAYLLEEVNFNFLMRIKKNTLISKTKDGKGRAAKDLFNKTRFKSLRKPRYIWGHKLYVGGQHIKKDEYFILVSDVSVSSGKVLYGERWSIEVFFRCCKKRGFNFEDTHVTKPERIHNMLFIIALAFCWTLLTGRKLIKKGLKVPIKTIVDKSTEVPTVRRAPLKCIFTVGLEHLRKLLLNFKCAVGEIRLLSCT